MIPLLARYPALAMVPRVSLGTFPTPVAPLTSISRTLWIKRDDLCAEPLGGNKARALEFLLGGVQGGSAVVTVGSEGSTHALAVATYAHTLGARAYVGRWKQEMNETAEIIAVRTASAADEAPIFRTPIGAYLYAARKVRGGGRWIPAGGSTPIGILGHVNAGLELVAQIDAGVLPEPTFVVVPLGTGGTAAGLALAFAIMKRPITVVGARVVPLIVAHAWRVRYLAAMTARLIENLTGQTLPRVRSSGIRVASTAYGGAYGRATTLGHLASDRMRAEASIALDASYSAKAFSEALLLGAHAPTLFWLTFDSRTLSGPK